MLSSVPLGIYSTTICSIYFKFEASHIKSCSSMETNNYWPISILPIISNLLECYVTSCCITETEVKLLGVNIDNKLKFDKQFDKLCKSAVW